MSDDPEIDPEISLYEKAEDTWELSKKLGFYAENEDDIVKTLVWKAKASFEEPLKNKAKNKRGRRKSKRKKI